MKSGAATRGCYGALAMRPFGITAIIDPAEEKSSEAALAEAKYQLDLGKRLTGQKVLNVDENKNRGFAALILLCSERELSGGRRPKSTPRFESVAFSVTSADLPLRSDGAESGVFSTNNRGTDKDMHIRVQRTRLHKNMHAF